MAKSKSVEPTVEVEHTAVAEKKKKKKSKTSEEVEVSVETLKREAVEAAADEEPKKKKKKTKTTEEAAAKTEEPKAAEEEPAAEAGEKKKKKKKKAAEEEATTETAESAAPMDVDSEEKPKKKKKKSADAATEEAAEEKKTSEEDAETEAPAEDKEDEEEKKEDTSAESKEVIIFGLQWEADEEVVKKDFEECGEIVSFRMPVDRETGKYKGMAFCEYATAEGVKKALDYNETEYSGRTLRVRICEPDGKGKGKDGKGKGKKGKDGKGKGKGKDGKGKGSYTPGEKPEGCKSVILKWLNYETVEDSIRSHFEDCGDIQGIKLLTDRETGASKGMAFVDFDSEEAVDKAVKKCNSELDGKNIIVDYNTPREKGDGKGKDGKKGGKGDGKKGKGKGKKGKKGKEGDSIKAANMGSIQEFAGAKKSFDSDSE
ncbi:unnamed protein product [Amoebophrya sp. A25]|nr:unnamed protein product [Amoebophrya sp. A25]|eukprot:GSA25T00011160001.1